ncbi:MAG: hypothetical protein M3015_12140 [Bacteroidota bacterium]|nr:hypothetical protein [Bacteroidota bacterium]
MLEASIKNKIHKSLEKLDAEQLQSAWNILQALFNQQKNKGIKIDESALEQKITNGITQLNNGEGSDFDTFLNEMQSEYASRQ